MATTDPTVSAAPIISVVVRNAPAHVAACSALTNISLFLFSVVSEPVTPNMSWSVLSSNCGPLAGEGGNIVILLVGVE